jgi:hypothetical protein
MAQGNAIRAGRAFVELFADNDRLVRDLKRAEAKVRAFGAKVQRIGRQMVTAGAVLAAPLAAAVKHFADVGDQLDKMSKRTGVSVETLSELGFAAEQTGSNLDAVGNALQRMNRRLGRITAGQASSTQKEALESLGLSAERLRQLSPEQRLKAIADAMASMEDQAEAAGLAQRAFGTEVDKILPLLLKGREGIEQLQREFRDMGGTMSQEAAADAARLTDAMNEARQAISIVTRKVGAALAPMLTDVSQKIRDQAGAWAQWVQQNQQTIVTTAKWVAGMIAAGAALVTVGTSIKSVATILGTIPALLTAISAHPLLAALAGVSAIVTGVALAINDATNAMSDMSSAAQTQLRQADQQRAADQRRLKQLKRLDEQQELSESQMKEAENIISRLEGRYGELGLSINKTTGEIEGLAGAQSRLNKKMREAAIQDVKANINELENNAEKARKAFMQRRGLGEQTIARDFQAARSFAQNALGFGDPAEQAKERLNQIRQRLSASRKRLDALQGGENGDALTGDAGREGPSAAERRQQAEAKQNRQRALQKRQELEQRIAELRIKKQKQGIDRELALIDLRYDREAERIRQLEDLEEGKKKQLLEQLNVARDLAKQRARRREQEQQEKQRQREQQRIEQANERRRKQVRRLEIKANNEGLEEQRKLLKFREKQAIKEAKRNNENVELVKREFALRRKLLQQQQQSSEQDDSVAGGALGGFSAAALDRRLGTGSAQERTAKASEQTAENTRLLREAVEDGEAGAVFT